MTTLPTNVSAATFLETVSSARRDEAHQIIAMMQTITGLQPVMWGPSIIGFGTMHYKYDSGREGDMPRLAFSPRKASLTIYFEGFEAYTKELEELGKYKTSVACLYVTKLADINTEVLRRMLEKSFAATSAS